MEVVVKNTTDNPKVCVVFGQYDRSFNHDYAFEPCLPNMETGKGVQIIIDGDDSDERRLELINKSINEPIEFNSMEFSSNITKLHEESIRVINKDDNRDTKITIIKLINYFSAYQTELYPIEIKKDWKISKDMSIYIILRPSEEVKMKFSNKNE